MLDKKVPEKIKMKQKHINVNGDLTSFGYRKYGFSTNGTQVWILDAGKSLNDKINKKQKYINTNEDLSTYGYKRYRLSSNGTLRWILESFQKLNGKKYYLKHVEENKIQCKAYREKNIINLSENSKVYYKENKKELLEKQKIRYRLHKEQIIEQVKKYRHSEKGKEIHKRQTHERRELGFNSLNKLIDGIECDAHHINENDVIYIPTIIHQKIPHNLKTGKNMKLINSIAEGFK